MYLLLFRFKLLNSYRDYSSQVVANSDVIFVAVKPQYVSLVLTEVRPVLNPNSVIVSIAAGVTLETLKVGVFRSTCEILSL